MNQDSESYFSASENLLNIPVASKIFYTSALYLSQICFSSYLICPFYQIFNLKKTPELAAEETQALQKPGGTPWDWIFPECEKIAENLHDIAASWVRT